MKDLLVCDVPGAVLRPESAFSLPFWSWLAAPTPSRFTYALAYAILIMANAAALSLIAGKAPRIAASALFAIYATTFVLDQLAYTNNVFLLLLLLAATIAESHVSARRTALYPQRLVQLLLTAMYLTAGAVKLSEFWLSGAILRAALFTYHGVYSRFLGWDFPWLFRLGAIASMVLELALAATLWFRKTRRVAVLAGIAFHLSIDILMPVRMFSYLVIAAYVTFLPSTDLARLQRRFPSLRVSARALTAGVVTALSVDAFFAYVLHAFSLPVRNLSAACIALFTFGAWQGLVPSPFTYKSCSSSIPVRARFPVVAVVLVVEAFLAVKPLLGFTNRFAWRMFTEKLELRARAETRDGSAWTEVPIDSRWSATAFRPYWDSLGEQRNFLRGFAEWRHARDALHRQVCVRVAYRINDASTESEDICAP